MQEAVDLNKEGKTLTYPKLIIGQCVDSNALAKQIASHTTFSRGRNSGRDRLSVELHGGEPG